MKLEHLLSVKRLPKEARQELEELINTGHLFNQQFKKISKELIEEEHSKTRYFEPDVKLLLNSGIISEEDLKFLGANSLKLEYKLILDYFSKFDLLRLRIGFFIIMIDPDNLIVGGYSNYHSEAFLLFPDSLEVKRRNLSFAETSILESDVIIDDRDVNLASIRLFNKEHDKLSSVTELRYYPICYTSTIELLDIVKAVSIKKVNGGYMDYISLLDIKYSETLHKEGFSDEFLYKSLWNDMPFLYSWGLRILELFNKQNAGVISDSVTLLMVLKFFRDLTKDIFNQEFSTARCYIYCKHAVGDCKKEDNRFDYVMYLLLNKLDRNNLLDLRNDIVEYYSKLNDEFEKEEAVKRERSQQAQQSLGSLVEKGLDFIEELDKMQKTSSVNTKIILTSGLNDIIRDQIKAKGKILSEHNIKLLNMFIYDQLMRVSERFGHQNGSPFNPCVICPDEDCFECMKCTRGE